MEARKYRKAYTLLLTPNIRSDVIEIHDGMIFDLKSHKSSGVAKEFEPAFPDFDSPTIPQVKGSLEE